jgi:hypothetical protein
MPTALPVRADHGPAVYNSALQTTTEELFMPPAMRTLPGGSGVPIAAHPLEVMVPADVKKAVAGS